MDLSGIASDRSFISYIHSYPLNTEVRTIKTYNSSASQTEEPVSAIQPVCPAADAAGVVTMELNNSFVMLPAIPMRTKLSYSWVGYFASEYSVYTETSQKTKTNTFISRWRLEPKEKDLARWRKDKSVEPKKPIIYYIDPATPKQWRSLPDCGYQ